MNENNLYFFGSEEERDWYLNDTVDTRPAIVKELLSATHDDYNFGPATGVDIIHSHRAPNENMFIVRYENIDYYFMVIDNEIVSTLKRTCTDDGYTFNKLYVIPEYRHEGVCHALLEVAEAECMSDLIQIDLTPKEILIHKGLEELEISKQEEQLSLNKQFARKMGYKVTGNVAVRSRKS